jgi:polyhydroxyalkanoate synthesis regulator phasin
MATVSERIKDTFSNAKLQLEGLPRKVEALEKKAKESLDDVPAQLKGAWEIVIDRVRGALDYASREDLHELSARVDELAKKVERLIRGDKIRQAAKDTKAPPKRA